MSKPRKPYGPNPPGRLQATMIKVLAAEMSDSGRLGRGKRYWNDDAVIDLVIGHGVVNAEVQGSRPQPYVITISAAPGKGVPGRQHVRVRCTCPDDDGFDAACKHAVAALFALSDEVAIDPTVIDRWRGTEPAGIENGNLDDTDFLDAGSSSDGVDRSGWASVTRLQPRPTRPWERAGSLHREDRYDVDDHDGDSGGVDDDVEWGSRLNRVVPLRRRPSDTSRNAAEGDASDDDAETADGDSAGESRLAPSRAPNRVTADPSIAQIASLLHSPSGVGAPAFPTVHPITHPAVADRTVDEVMVSALGEFDVNW